MNDTFDYSIETDSLNVTWIDSNYALNDDKETDVGNGCYGATPEEMAWYAKFSFAIDLVVQTIVGAIGLVANVIAIFVLCR